MRDILVFTSAQQGAVSKVGLETLAAGRELAKALETQVDALLIGSDADTVANELAARGAATVYTASDPVLANFVPEFYIQCIETAIKQVDPGVIIFCADSIGRDLAPKIAYRLNSALITEAIKFDLKDKNIHWTRPVYGGNAMAVMHSCAKQQVVTIRAHTFDPAELSKTAGKIVKLPIKLDHSSIVAKVVDVIKESAEGIRIEDAEVVIAGGRGIGGKEGFKDLEVLASVLGGAVAATRAATDAGWVPLSKQVGQTGKIIAPNLYIAVGISGASQHLQGISNAKNVVAINKDEEAPIFQRATLGVVADYKTVLPTLIEYCSQMLDE